MTDIPEASENVSEINSSVGSQRQIMTPPQGAEFVSDEHGGQLQDTGNTEPASFENSQGHDLIPPQGVEFISEEHQVQPQESASANTQRNDPNGSHTIIWSIHLPENIVRVFIWIKKILCFIFSVIKNYFCVMVRGFFSGVDENRDQEDGRERTFENERRYIGKKKLILDSPLQIYMEDGTIPTESNPSWFIFVGILVIGIMVFLLSLDILLLSLDILNK